MHLVFFVRTSKLIHLSIKFTLYDLYLGSSRVISPTPGASMVFIVLMNTRARNRTGAVLAEEERLLPEPVPSVRPRR